MRFGGRSFVSDFLTTFLACSRTPCSQNLDRFGGVREAGGSAWHHEIPSARMARKGAPALSGEGRPTECALRRGRYYRGLARQSRRSMLAACRHDLVLCLAGQRLLARGASCFRRFRHSLRPFRPISAIFGFFGRNSIDFAAVCGVFLLISLEF